MSFDKGLLLDLDGTLIDNIEDIYGVFVRFHAQHACTTNRKQFYKYNGIPLEEVLLDLKNYYQLKESIQELLDEYKHLLNDLDEAAVIRETALDVLSYARKNGYRIALVTSSLGARARLILENNSLSEYFDVLVCSDDVTTGKPDKEPFELAIHKLGLKAGRTIAVEDSLNGIISAKLAGSNVYYLTRPGYQLSAQEESHILKQINNFSELMDILKNA